MKKIGYLLLWVVLVSACSSQEKAEQQEVRDTVLAYTRLLAEGYNNLNMNPLSRIATPKRAAKAYHHMAALGEGRVRMAARLADISFLTADKRSRETAEAKTSERWKCAYFSIDSGEKVSENIVTYEIVYHLVRDQGRWLVDDLDIAGSSETNKDGGLPFFQRPPDEPPGSPAKKKLPEK